METYSKQTSDYRINSCIRHARALYERAEAEEGICFSRGKDEVAFERSCGHIALLLLIHSAFKHSFYQIPYTIARLSRSSSNNRPWSSLVGCSLYAPLIRRNG